jgi:hypothetical protein
MGAMAKAAFRAEHPNCDRALEDMGSDKMNEEEYIEGYEY